MRNRTETRKTETRAGNLRSLRFSQEADTLLRGNLPHKGDMRARIVKAAEETDLDALDIPKDLRHPVKTGGATYYATSASIPDSVWDRLRDAAVKKGVSVALLVDQAVVSYWGAKDRA